MGKTEPLIDVSIGPSAASLKGRAEVHPSGSGVPVDVQDRLIEGMRRAIPLLPADMRKQVASLLTAENLRLTAGVLGVWASLHLVGDGEIIDVGLLAVGVLTLGTMAFDVAGLISKFVSGAVAATTSTQLSAAAAHLASAISLLGVVLFTALIMRKSSVGSSKQSQPLRFALTPAEMLYKLGFRRMAPALLDGAATSLEFLEKRVDVVTAENWMRGMDLHSAVKLTKLENGAKLVGYMEVEPGVIARIKAQPSDFEEIIASLKPTDLKIGRFFTKSGTSMDQLGMTDGNRIYCRFSLNLPAKTTLEVLQSTASSIKAWWTVPAELQTTTKLGNIWYEAPLANGGGTQYVIPESRVLFSTGQLEMTSIGAGKRALFVK